MRRPSSASAALPVTGSGRPWTCRPRPTGTLTCRMACPSLLLTSGMSARSLLGEFGSSGREEVITGMVMMVVPPSPGGGHGHAIDGHRDWIRGSHGWHRASDHQTEGIGYRDAIAVLGGDVDAEGAYVSGDRCAAEGARGRIEAQPGGQGVAGQLRAVAERVACIHIGKGVGIGLAAERCILGGVLGGDDIGQRGRVIGVGHHEIESVGDRGAVAVFGRHLGKVPCAGPRPCALDSPAGRIGNC